MKTVVITGANVGIGFATAKHLAAIPGWHVVLACRNEIKAHAAIHNLQQILPHSRFTFVPLDLFSLASVRRFPAQVSAAHIPPLHAVVLNAGGINMKAKSLEFTADRFERTFQLNFLGHFLLANLLIENMAPRARIVFVSSDLHDPAATKMGTLMPPKYGPVVDLAHGTGTAANLQPMARYATAKMYAIMTAYELARRLRESGKPITVNTWSPGVVPTTQAGRDMNPLMKKIMTSRWFVRCMGSHLATEEEAAQALARLLTDETFAEISGRYFDGFDEVPSSVESQDEAKARAVWEQAARLADIDHRHDPMPPLKSTSPAATQ